jgi:cytochrome c-type biogenesis protein CcmE|tara:strand:- start:33 stop:488 length:456 start_codon:yes stop_codon:yes gene_type:complete
MSEDKTLESQMSETNFVSTNRIKLLISALVLLGALCYFAFMAFQGATVYYYTVGEAKDINTSNSEQMLRVSGKLVPTSFTRKVKSTKAYFELTDGTYTMEAIHDGLLPDLFFNEHSEIILEGSFSDDHIFHSQNVIVKCPSKYVAIEENQS